jgi:hypothetical protein
MDIWRLFAVRWIQHVLLCMFMLVLLSTWINIDDERKLSTLVSDLFAINEITNEISTTISNSSDYCCYRQRFYWSLISFVQGFHRWGLLFGYVLSIVCRPANCQRGSQLWSSYFYVKSSIICVWAFLVAWRIANRKSTNNNAKEEENDENLHRRRENTQRKPRDRTRTYTNKGDKVLL